jgi:hypothetical protein
MMRRIFEPAIFVLISISLAAVGQDCLSQTSATNIPLESYWDNGIGHSTWSLALEAPERERVIALWNAIGEDLKTEKNPLAGTYVKGGDSGYFLRWSPRKGFVVIPYFDQNLITDYGYGQVNFIDSSEIIFSPEKQLRGGRGLEEMPRTWTAIWHYFVPVDQLKDFGEYHAGLGDYNEFNGQCCEFVPTFLATRVDAPERASSLPVPDKYRRFMKEPINGKIVLVGKKKTVKDWGYEGELYSDWMEKAVLVPVTINVGSRQGVKNKMLFRIASDSDFWSYLQITKVQQTKAHGVVVHDRSFSTRQEALADKERESRATKIRVGVEVTTKTAPN